MIRQTDEALNGLIDAGCTIRGELEFKNSFRLYGRMEGHIRSESELMIGEEGVVEGEIEVGRCLIGGTVRGTIRATEHVVFHSSAKVWADVHTPALVMEDGAFLEGKVSMDGIKDGAKSGKKAAGENKASNLSGKKS